MGKQIHLISEPWLEGVASTLNSQRLVNGVWEAIGPVVPSERDHHAPCASCGTLTPLRHLDAKPDDPHHPDTCDWSRLECRDCYGPDYLSLDGSVRRRRGLYLWLVFRSWCRRVWFRRNAA